MSFDLPALPEDWSYIPLEKLAQKNSVTYGVVQPGPPVENGVPIVRVNNFKDGRIELADVMCIAADIESKYGRTRLQGGEVLLTIVGSVGQVAVVPQHLKGFNVARAVAVIHPISEVEPEWLALCLRSPLSQHVLGSRANTTVQTTINLKDLRAMPVPMPPKDKRKQLVRMLGALDDRINLLRETNATLEAIAQALFKSWFVDFDPVRAKAEGRQPEGMNPPTAALFPDTFEDSELGPIPKGWSVASLDAYLDVLETGKRPKGGVSEFKEGMPSIGAESIVGVGKFDFSKLKYVPFEFFEKMKAGLVEGYDVLLYKDGGKPGDFRPRVSLFGEAFPFSKFVINEHVFRLRSKALGQPFLYFQISHERILWELRNRGAKAAIPGINQGDVRSLKCLVPSSGVLDCFNCQVSNFLKAILLGSSKAQTLMSIRDALLPRLISGQLRLPEAEAQIEEALA